MKQIANDLVGIFNPSNNYDGSYCFHPKVFQLVQKSDKVDKYLEKILFSKVREVFKSAYLGPDFGLLLENNPEVYGKSTKLNVPWLISQYVTAYTGKNIDINDKTTEEIAEEARSILKQFRSELKKCINNEPNEIQQLLEDSYDEYIKYHKQTSDNGNPPLSFKNYVSKLQERCKDFTIGLRFLHLIDHVSIDIDYLKDCVDIDKLYLSMAKQIVDSSLIIEKSEGMVHNSIIVANTYKKKVEEMRKKGEYKVKTTTCDLFGNLIENYTIEDFLKELNELFIRHPEFIIIEEKVETTDDYRDYETYMAKQAEFERKLKIQKISGEWNFIPAGHKPKEDLDDESENNPPVDTIDLPGKSDDDTKKSPPVDKEILKIAELNARREFLNNSSPLFILEGKHNFEGYIGYLYENGKVVFEKFYDDVNTIPPTPSIGSNATYVMDINNFIEMSQKTKPEIMEYIKSGESGVQRIYHTKNWKKKITNVINSESYDENILDTIEAVLNEAQKGK